MIIRDSSVHHLSNLQVYQKRAIGKLDAVLTSIDFKANYITVIDFDSDDSAGKLIFNTNNSVGSKNYVYNLNQSSQIQSNSSYNLPSNPNKIFMKGNIVYYFYGSYILKGSLIPSSRLDLAGRI